MTDPSSITSTGSTPLLRTALPPKGILKNSTPPVTPPTASPSPFEGERISMAPAEEKISSLKKEKKSVCFFPVVTTGTKETKFLYDDPTYGNGKAKMTQTRTPLTPSETSSSQESIDLSLEILNWAENRFTAAKQELKDANAMLTSIKQDVIPEAGKLKSELEEWISVARERSLQAKRYAVWAELRMELIKGNENIEKLIHEKGLSIGGDWTIEEMNEDFAMTQAQPWAQPPDPSFDAIRRKISTFMTQDIVSKNASRGINNAISNVASLVASKPKPQQKEKEPAISTNSADSDYVPGKSTPSGYGIYRFGDGSYDFSEPYELQIEEVWEDGTVVKVDPYDGRRFWFHPSPPPGNNACTVS